MRLYAPKEFVNWLNSQPEGSSSHRYGDAALRFLRSLPARPSDDLPPILKRVRQARRHQIWRVSHPYDPGAAVRVLCWFPEADTAVVALVGGDKASIGDLWYDSATPRAELAVDHWLRTHPPQNPGDDHHDR